MERAVSERDEENRRSWWWLLVLLLLLLLGSFGFWRFCTKHPAKPLQKSSITKSSGSKAQTKPTCRSKRREVCDGRDNDCDGRIDEGFKLSCSPCQRKSQAKSDVCIQAEVVGGAWFAGKARNLVLGSDHGITLPLKPKHSPYIYIANSAEGTVSKLRIRDGVEVGRFYVGDNPSRTAVDSDGNAWIVMRGRTADKGKGKVQENVVKIDGACQPKVRPPQTTRECISLDIPEVGNLLRGVAVDATGQVWVGAYATSEVIHLDGRSGQIRRRISLPESAQPYGLAVDERGFVWVASRTGKLAVLRIDPLTYQVDQTVPLSGLRNSRPYGIASDGEGSIWLGSNGPLIFQLDGKTGVMKRSFVVGGQTRGVVADHRGWLWIADSRRQQVHKLSRATGEVLGSFAVGRSPVGVAVDHDGAVWAVNLMSHNATKLSPTGQELGTYAVGKSPYTYSDMTGTAYHVFKTLHGVFRGQYSVGWKGAKWKSLQWKGKLAPTTTLKIRVRAADSKKLLKQKPWTALSLQKQRAGLAVQGAYIELEIAMSTSERTRPSFLDNIVLTLHP